MVLVGLDKLVQVEVQQVVVEVLMEVLVQVLLVEIPALLVKETIAEEVEEYPLTDIEDLKQVFEDF